MKTSLFAYTLHLADNALILAQRNSEWCGHGPVLEHDIALTNISLDLLGQARNFYQLAATQYNQFSNDEKKETDILIPRLWKTYNRELTEDDLAFLRDEHQYLNLLLTELPKGDWAQTILRQFFFSAFQQLLFSQLQNSTETALAAIAEKAIKETTYHLRWSSEWVIRLGDGTEESHFRLSKAVEELWRHTQEFFIPAWYEKEAEKKGFGINVAGLKEAWQKKVTDIFQEATVPLPQDAEQKSWVQLSGKDGRHTEHMGYLLAEMQYLQRTYPNSVW